MIKTRRFLYFSLGFLCASVSFAVVSAQEVLAPEESPKAEDSTVIEQLVESNIQEEPIEEVEPPKFDEGELPRPYAIEGQTKKRSLFDRIKGWVAPKLKEGEEKIYKSLIGEYENAKFQIEVENKDFFVQEYQHDENGCISFSNKVVCGTFIITKIK